jgi:hypothetical protein
MDHRDEAAELSHKTSRLALSLSKATQHKLSELLSESDVHIASILKAGLDFYEESPQKNICKPPNQG